MHCRSSSILVSRKGVSIFEGKSESQDEKTGICCGGDRTGKVGGDISIKNVTDTGEWRQRVFPELIVWTLNESLLSGNSNSGTHEGTIDITHTHSSMWIIDNRHYVH